MTFRITTILLFSGLIVGSVVLAQQSSNRLGSHFDSGSKPRAEQIQQFQTAVNETVNQTAGSHYSSTRAASGGTGSPSPSQSMPIARRDENPGFPLDSADQQAWNLRNQSSAPAQPRVRPVAFEPMQQGNSFAPLTQPNNPAPQQPALPNFGAASNEPQIGGNTFNNGNNSNSDIGRTSNDTILVENSTIRFIHDIELPAQEAGQIKTLTVQEGDSVKAGTIVGRIDDELFMQMLQQAKFRLQIAQDKASETTSLEAAENEIELQRIIFERTRDLQAKGSAPLSELQETMFRYRLARLKKVAAQNEMDAANGESKVEMARTKEVEAHIKRHTLSVDFDGHVLEVFKHPLEWVDAGEPVVRVVRMDKLRADGVVSTNDINPHQLTNRRVTVSLPMAGGKRETFEGRIVNVGMERESTEFVKVKAEIDNRRIEGHWMLQAGAGVTIEVHLNEAGRTTSALK